MIIISISVTPFFAAIFWALDRIELPTANANANRTQIAMFMLVVYGQMRSLAEKNTFLANALAHFSGLPPFPLFHLSSLSTYLGFRLNAPQRVG